MNRIMVVVVAVAAVACSAHAQPSPTGFFANGDVKLSYEFTKPVGRGPFPGVVIGHGSGLAKKEDCRYLSASFLRRGYATLCYDKRGVGQSTGTYTELRSKKSNSLVLMLKLALTFLPFFNIKIPPHL